MATTLAAKSGSRGSTCTSSKFWLVMVVMMLTFMCSGVIYGWTGMLLILRKEGVYQQYSEGEQEEKFDLIMTIASFFTAGSGLFIGVFLDAFGPRITALCSGVVTIAGCFVFGFQWNLTVGYAMFAVGGMGILISSFRAAYLFPAHQSLVIGSISCLFDSSTVIFVVFDVLYENFGLTLKQLCMGYAAICLLLQIALFALWSMNPTFDRLQAKAEEPDEAKVCCHHARGRADPCSLCSCICRACWMWPLGLLPLWTQMMMTTTMLRWSPSCLSSSSSAPWSSCSSTSFAAS